MQLNILKLFILVILASVSFGMIPLLYWLTYYYSADKLVEFRQETTMELSTCSLDALDVVPDSAKQLGCTTTCQNMTCKALLFSPPSNEVYSASRQWMKANREFLISLLHENTILNLTKNCDKYKTKRGYHTEAPTIEEAEFPIAFSILMHKDVAQVERLLRAIYRPQNEYCIHVDAKQRGSFLIAMKAIASCFPNVLIASRLERVTYAGFSRLQADINCMGDLVNKVNTRWKYLINVAGQSFPLRTNLEMVKILKIYNGSNDIGGDTGHEIFPGHFHYEWIENKEKFKMEKTGNLNPEPPYNIIIVKGSAYGIFSRQFVEFVLNDKRSIALLKWSEKTYSPDEHFWATLNNLHVNPQLNSPGGYKGKPDGKSLMAVYASWLKQHNCAGKFRHYICIFGVGDLSSLIHQKHFFASKFYMTYQPFALDCMEQWLEYKVRCPQKFDGGFYRALPQKGGLKIQPGEYISH